MKARALLACGLTLVLVLLWVILHRPASSSAPLAAPDSASTTSTPSAPLSLVEPEQAGPSAQSRSIAVGTDIQKTPAADSVLQTIVLFGTVTCPPDAVSPDDESWMSATDRFGARTAVHPDADGAYSISGLAPGHYWVLAGRVAASAHAEVDLSLAESPKRFDILLEEDPTILVKVVDSRGESLTTPGLLAVATMTRPGDWFNELTDRCNNAGGLGGFREGRYTGGPLPEGYLGRIKLDVQPPLFVSLLNSQRIIATQQVERGQHEAVFNVDADSKLLKSSSVRVRFVDQNGAAVSGVWAELSGDSSRTMVADGDSLLAPKVSAGHYELRPLAKGLEMRIVPVTVEPGTEMDLGAVTLEPAQSVSGSVRCGSEDISRVAIRCDPCEPDGSTKPSRCIHTYMIKADGSFSLPFLSRGLYLLSIEERENKHGAWARIIDTRAGPVNDVRVELTRGVSLVVRPAKYDGAMVRFRILDGGGAPVVASRLWGAEPRPILMAPGEYDVEVRVSDAGPTRKHVTIGTEPVELSLP